MYMNLECMGISCQTRKSECIEDVDICAIKKKIDKQTEREKTIKAITTPDRTTKKQ